MTRLILSSCYFADAQADSGFNLDLYRQLAEAPVLLLDARAKASAEHASFEELRGLGECRLNFIGERREGRQARAVRPAESRQHDCTHLITVCLIG